MQQTFLITNSLLKANKEGNSLTSIKINQLSDAKKDFITECFINLAKLDFRKQFLLWFDNKLDKETPGGQKKAEEVQEGIEQSS